MSSTTEISWVNGSLADAADMLAKRATVTRKLITMKKESIDLSSIGDTLSGNPMLQKALIGAGVGAGIGGVTSMFAPKEKRKSFRSVLTGALAGGGLGVGAHYLGKALPSGGGGSGSSSFTHGGNTYALDPKALAANPAAMQELNELMQKTPGEGVAGAIQGVFGGYAGKHPILASILGADIASQTVGTLAGLSPGSAKRISPRVDVLQRGFELMKDVEDTPGVAKKVDALNDSIKAINKAKDTGIPLEVSGWNKAVAIVADAKNSPTRARDLLRKAQGVLASGFPEGDITTEIAEHIKVMSDKGQGVFRRGGLESLRDIVGGDHRDMLAGTGAPGSTLLSSSGKIPFTNTDLPKWLGGNKARNLLATDPASLREIIQNVRNKQYGLAGTQLGSSAARGFSTAGNPFRAMGRFGRIVPRAALYAGLPLLQAYAGAVRAPGQRERRIMELVKSLSK